MIACKHEGLPNNCVHKTKSALAATFHGAIDIIERGLLYCRLDIIGLFLPDAAAQYKGGDGKGNKCEIHFFLHKTALGVK